MFLHIFISPGRKDTRTQQGDQSGAGEVIVAIQVRVQVAFTKEVAAKVRSAWILDIVGEE